MYLLDTNILIDYLKGYEPASQVLEQSQGAKISIITWMEVLVGTTTANRHATESFLQCFEVIELNHMIAQQAVSIRQRHRVKLPDAIIWASAQHYNCTIVTRNTKDFAKTDSVRTWFPYLL